MANLAGFNCWAEPENKDIAIVLSLKEPGMFQIQDATLSDGAVLRTPTNKISPNSALKFGTTRVVVSRPNTDIPISLTVNIVGDFKGYSCRAVVPAVMQLPPPWTPRKIRGSAPTSKPGENINIQQVGKNFHWDLDSRTPEGKLAFQHSLDGYFTSPSHIVGSQKRKNVDPASSQNGCVIVQLLEGDVPQDYVVDFIMRNAPASEQPSGTVKGDGKFCDLYPDWSGQGRLNIQ